MAIAKKSPASKAGPAKKTGKSRKAAASKKSAAPKKPAARKAPPRKAATRKAAPKKAAARKAPPKKPRAASPGAQSRAKNTSGASAPRNSQAGAGANADQGGSKSFKPQMAAAAEAIESTISDFIETADVRNFPDKLWRLLAMVAFAFVGYWVFVATVILAAMQWVVVLLGDKPSPEIAHYMERSSAYVRQVLDLLSYRSETLPWPLGPLPGEDAGD